MIDIKNGAYDVYFYIFDNSTDYTYLERRLSLLDTNTRISIRDIKDESLEEKIRILNSMMTISRGRKYDDEKDLPSYVDIVRLTADKYVGMVSICENVLGEEKAKEVLKALFITPQYEYYVAGNSWDKCVEFWQHMINAVPIDAKKEKDAIYKIEGVDTFEIDIHEIDKYEELVDKKSAYLKAVITNAISKVMCATTGMRSVIGQDIHDHGRLARLPIYLTDTNNEKVINSISGFFSDVDFHDDISFDELNGLCNFDIDEQTMYTQYVISDRRVRTVFKNMKVDTLYRFPTITYLNCPIHIVVSLKKNSFVIHYFYDKLFFSNISIEGFHEAISKLTVNTIKGIYTDIKIRRIIAKKSEAEKKSFDARIAVWKRLEGFGNIPDNAIEKLAIECGVTRKFSEQCIISEGEQPGSLYIIVKGRVALERRDNDNHIHTLMILKERDVFGIESLMEGRKSKTDYRVVGDDAALLVIDKKLFWQYASRYPSFVKRVLEIQTDRLETFGKLWSMS